QRLRNFHNIRLHSEDRSRPTPPALSTPRRSRASGRIGHIPHYPGAHRLIAICLGATLLFSVLAFAATEQWALSIAQLSIFSLGAACAIRRQLRWTPLAIAPAGAVCIA